MSAAVVDGCAAKAAAGTRGPSTGPPYETLTAIGVGGFTERAHRELAATGETVRQRTVEAAADLTDQEAHIARLAADGLTNPEIGAALYISPRTVERHLRKGFHQAPYQHPARTAPVTT